MNPPSPAEFNPDKINAEEREIPLGTLQEQYLNLKFEFEELQNKFTRLRSLLQTLVVGLLVAVLLTIGISGWFAYRLLVQEQIARRETEKSVANHAEMLEKLEEMDAQLQRQKQQIQTFREEVPEELEALTNAVQANQRQLKLLRDRIEQSEPKALSSERTN